MQETKLGVPQAILLGAVIIAAAILLTRGTLSKTGGPAAALQEGKEVAAVSANDHLYGNPNAPVVVIEFSDLECPYCKTFHPIMHELVESSGGTVAWVYRHFPLDTIHTKARLEAEAAECAAELGGNTSFWNYIDRVFAITPSNDRLEEAKLLEIGNDIGINPQKLSACIKEGKYQELIEAQLQDGIRAGVNGTPGSVVMNMKTGAKTLLVGAASLEEMRAAVEAVK